MHRTVIAIVAALMTVPSILSAVSPDVVRGRLLFEREWQPKNSSLGGDGLGPLFNGNSCVVCHHQGGVGGGGEAEFNANTIGIEEMQIKGGLVDDAVIATIVRTFHPGFVASNGAVQNTLVIAHHGGSPAYVQARKNLLGQLASQFSENGGSRNAVETRLANATPIHFQNQVGKYRLDLRARVFQRNTTPLFGTGLIDQITDKQILAIAKAQTRHPEISGRPSTLKNGRIGKFGWRANIETLLEFNDQACANEMGLETRRKPQGDDPMVPRYRNPSFDVDDRDVKQLHAFVAALPAPTRALPEGSSERSNASYGEEVFKSIGCAFCHVPDLGPARGLYSDILLHDMGYESMDLNHAEPYVIRRTPALRTLTSYEIANYVETTNSLQKQTQTMSFYYGGSSTISAGTISSSSNSGGSGGARIPGQNQVNRPIGAANGYYRFVAPRGPDTKLKLIPIDQKVTTGLLAPTTKTERNEDDFRITEKTRFEQIAYTSVTTAYLRIHYEPTNFNQEWRTPPLWGVADSAPYMHDGRAETLLEAIAMHDGEGAGTRDRFLNLPIAQRHAIVAFLNTLVAPPNAPEPQNPL